MCFEQRLATVVGSGACRTIRLRYVRLIVELIGARVPDPERDQFTSPAVKCRQQSPVSV